MLITLRSCHEAISPLLIAVCFGSTVLHSLGRIQLAFAQLHFVSKAKLACYSRYFLTSYFCIPVPYNEKDIFF